MVSTGGGGVLVSAGGSVGLVVAGGLVGFVVAGGLVGLVVAGSLVEVGNWVECGARDDSGVSNSEVGVEDGSSEATSRLVSVGFTSVAVLSVDSAPPTARMGVLVLVKVAF